MCLIEKWIPRGGHIGGGRNFYAFDGCTTFAQ